MSKEIKSLPHDHGSEVITALSAMPDDEYFAKYSGAFSLLGDSTRLKILWLLCRCEECVINIAAAVDMSSPAVSHHLRLLKQSGLIISKKVGKEVYYRIAETDDARSVHDIIDIVFYDNDKEKK